MNGLGYVGQSDDDSCSNKFKYCIITFFNGLFKFILALVVGIFLVPLMILPKLLELIGYDTDDM